MPHDERRPKRLVRVSSAPNLRLVRRDLTNETTRAAERAGINVTDDILHQLRKCIKRGGGSDSLERQMITEHLLMYFNVYRKQPSAKETRQQLEKLRKAIARLQGALPRTNDPAYHLLSNLRFASTYYSGKPEWTEFHTLAARQDHVGLADVSHTLELVHKFVVAAEQLVGSARARKYVGLDKLVLTFAAEWRFLTGQFPTSGRDPITSKQSGPFADFVRCAMLALPSPLRSQPVDSTIRSVCEYVTTLRTPKA